MKVVEREQLEALARTTPSPPPSKGRQNFGPTGDGLKDFDLLTWIADHSIPVQRQGPWGDGGYRFILQECVWNGHADNAAYIVRLPNGAIAAGCHHDSCQQYGWRELREHYEPGAYERSGKGEDERHGVTAPIGGRDAVMTLLPGRR